MAFVPLALLLVGCAAIPKPTPRQLEWQEMEIAALIHFNMASTGNCSADPSSFSPDLLNTDQWVETFEAFGAREAVLVAKHNCGFCTWPSNATMPDGSRYPYSVAFSSWKGGKGDVLSPFVESCVKRGLGVGYYYSLNENLFLKGLNFSSAQLQAIEEQQILELWTKYGNGGNLSELWFDGGITLAIQPFIKAAIQKHQRHAMAFNGCGGTRASCVTQNPINYLGNEAGAAPDPDWSTVNLTDGEVFAPPESDTTLQLTDSWFYDGKDGIRSLAELQDVYHLTVGHNSLLMMDFSPTPEGVIAPNHAARYKEFGDWQRGCYSEGSAGMVGIAKNARGSAEAGPSQLLTFGTPQVIDRVVVREDQTDGQAIRSWEVQAQLASRGHSTEWTAIANGTSMGNKWIKLLERNLTVSALRTVATATAPGTVARIRSTSAHLCSRSIPTGKCSVRNDWAADGTGNATNRNGDCKTVAECCEACDKLKGCALFVALPNPIDGHGCALYSATGVGGKVVKGAVSGSPQQLITMI